MPFLEEIVPSCKSIDCALDLTCDPNPNSPEKIKDASAESGIAVHARLTGETDVILETVKKLLHPELKLIIHPNFIHAPTAERNYHELERLMSDFYKL